MTKIYFLVFSFLISISASAADSTVREWTLLVYMNGNNSLSEYTARDINEMEVVGSTQNVNVVVQWASKENETTKRLLIQKDQDTGMITSPTIEDLPRVDMGDYHNLIEFVRWSVEHYPAKKYAIIVWNHGTGWHDVPAKDKSDPKTDSFFRRLKRGPSLEGISSDDYTHNYISTPQLGLAMQEAAKLTGGPIEFYGSDACSMASLEVATEMKDSVRYFVGSEELEDDNGWQYDTFLQQLELTPTVDGLGLGQIIADSYLASFSSANSMGGITLSVTDTSKLPALLKSMAALAHDILIMDDDRKYEVWSAADMSQRFWYDVDYKDAGSFFDNLVVAGDEIVSRSLVNELQKNLELAVVYKVYSRKYSNTTGLTLWMPQFNLIYDRFSPEYRTLRFNQITDWDSAMNVLVRPDQGPYLVTQ